MKKIRGVYGCVLIMILCVGCFLLFGVISKANTYDEYQVENLRIESDGYSYAELFWESKGIESKYIVYRKTANDLKYVKVCIVEGTCWSVRNMPEGSYVAYTVREYNEVTQNQNIIESDKINNAVDVLFKPNTVSDVRVSDIGGTSIKLSWSKSDSATEYEVYECNNGGYKKISSTNGNSISIDGLLGNTSYEFCVAVKVRVKGLKKDLVAQSEYSEIVQIKTLPAEVTNVEQILNNSENNICLKWDTPEGIDEIRLYVYENNAWQCIEKLPKTENSYTISGLVAGTQLKIMIRTCVHEGGVIFDAGGVTKTFITAPSKVENLKVKNVSDSKATITWSKSNGATNYLVYKYNNILGRYEIEKKLGDCDSYVMEGLNDLTKHNVKIVPQKEHPETKEMYQGLDVDAVVSFVTKLARVSDIKIGGMSKNSVLVKWKNVSKAREYKVTIYDKNNKVLKKENVSTNEYRYVLDKESTINVIFEIEAVAYLNTNGREICEYSYNLNKKELTNMIMPPKTIKLDAHTENSLSLSWNSVEGATKYYIYYITQDGNNNVIYNYVDETSYVNCKISNLEPGERRTYVIKAVSEDNGNQIESEYSKTYEFVTKIVAPKLSVKSVYSNATKKNCLRLTWPKVKNADKYIIYKKISGTSNEKELVVLEKDIICYDDYDVYEDKVYEYKIECVSVVGDKIYKSNKSDASVGKVRK